MSALLVKLVADLDSPLLRPLRSLFCVRVAESVSTMHIAHEILALIVSLTADTAAGDVRADVE